MDCPSWKGHQGISGTTAPCGTLRETCLAIVGGRIANEAGDEFFGHRFEDITDGERPPSEEEESADEETVLEPSLGPQEKKTARQVVVYSQEKPRLLVMILIGCTVKSRRW